MCHLFFFNDTATTDIYTDLHTLSLHDALPISIGKLAAAGGVGVETIRYYQRRGLLGTPVRSGGDGWGGGIRRYGDKDLRRLKFIRAAQAAGFTLDEISAQIGRAHV